MAWEKPLVETSLTIVIKEIIIPYIPYLFGPKYLANQIFVIYPDKIKAIRDIPR